MTTTEPTEAMIRRVEGLLRKAEGTNNPHEAEAFFAKAAELMDKYRITRAHLKGSGKGDLVRTDYPMAGYKFLRASVDLLANVANHYGCIVLIGSTGNHKVPTIVGDADDITATDMMFRSLIIQRDRALLNTPVPMYSNVNQFRNSFCRSYAGRINTRLKVIREAARQAARTESDSMALELFDRAESVRRQLGTKSANLNKPSYDGRGVRSGADAADRADLGIGPRLDGAGRRAIGR